MHPWQVSSVNKSITQQCDRIAVCNTNMKQVGKKPDLLARAVPLYELYRREQRLLKTPAEEWHSIKMSEVIWFFLESVCHELLR